MKISDTTLQDAKLIELDVFRDNRGFFTECYSEVKLKEHGIFATFVQDNHSLSKEAGVIRGMHFQRGASAQTKLIRVVSGAVWDVIVDIRKGSPTYGKWEGFILSQDNQRQLYVPKGFAHGFVTLTSNVNFLYKCDNYYDAAADGGIAFDDPKLSIDWPIDVSKAILSEKDAKHPKFEVFELTNDFEYGKV